MSNPVAVIHQTKVNNLRALLQASKSQIEMALPKHLTPDRLLRIAMTEASKNPMLLDCTQASFVGAIIQTAQLGLEPGGALGHSYLVPFKNKDKGVLEVQFIVGYRGMIDLAYRSPRVSKVIARPVFDQDEFSYEFGLEESIRHVPNQKGEGKELTHVYVVVTLKDGAKLFDVMTAGEVEQARGRSKAAEKGPWKTDYVAMALKSVVRRFFKYTPSSIELQQAITLDEAGDRGEQFNDVIGKQLGIPEIEKQDPTTAFKDDLNAEPENDLIPDKDFNQEPQGAFASFRVK